MKNLRRSPRRYLPVHRVASLAAALSLIAPTAQADTLYKCIGQDGRITYTNQKANQACTIISQDKPVSTYAPAARPRPSGGQAQQSSPSDFPRVSNNQQKARDNDRRAILEQELAQEQKQLEAAQVALSEQENLVPPEERIAGGGIQGGQREARLQTYRDKVQLHERNLGAIRREIGNIK